jgi:dipeptidyl aminopeptidase/acylaminoacyl peptidase
MPAPRRLCFVLLLFATVCAAQRGITAEDYLSFKFLSDPQISPDGKRVAYVQTTIDTAQNRRVSAIWLAAADGGAPPASLTTSPQSATSPRWSPDGESLAFLSARPLGSSAPATAETPRNQVYVLSMKGGEARRITNLKNGVNSFQWSPDGSRFVCVSRAGPSDAPGYKANSDVRHYTHRNYKFNDTGWFDDRRSHLWVAEVSGGEPHQITSGDDWDDADPQWSPDGTRIAFVSDRSGQMLEDSHNTDVWVIAREGGELTRISDHDEPDGSPRWSPDGKRIAFIGGAPEGEHPQIWLAPAGGGEKSVRAAKNLDMIPTDLSWSADGSQLFFATGLGGTYHLFRVTVGSGESGGGVRLDGAGEITQITSGDRSVRSPSRSDRAALVAYLVNDFRHLDDVFIAGLDGKNERRLTDANAALWKDRELAGVERLPYKGADNWDIDGFLVKPVGWTAGRKYPMILSIHGGPAGMYGVDWFHEFQVYAAKGWAVFYCNPRGSTGYGSKFQNGIRHNWGSKDYTDIMNGVEEVLRRNPWIDRERLGVTGGSYGGFMTNWVVGHSNIFKAAVTLRSISNFVSDEGTRDGAYGHKRDFGGGVFENFEYYWNQSPLKYAKNVKTPTLILHSDNDFRVPLEQGEQWFRALRLYGVTSELVIFPRENHNLTRTGEPKHLVESLNWQIYWFERFVDGNAAAKPPL